MFCDARRLILPEAGGHLALGGGLGCDITLTIKPARQIVENGSLQLVVIIQQAPCGVLLWSRGAVQLGWGSVGYAAVVLFFQTRHTRIARHLTVHRYSQEYHDVLAVAGEATCGDLSSGRRSAEAESADFHQARVRLDVSCASLGLVDCEILAYYISGGGQRLIVSDRAQNPPRTGRCSIAADACCAEDDQDCYGQLSHRNIISSKNALGQPSRLVRTFSVYSSSVLKAV